MYAKFNLTLDNMTFPNENYYLKKGRDTYSAIKKCAFFNLEQIISKKIIDGDALRNMWFPDEFFSNKNFIFISHSHADEELAIKLAGYLYEEFEIYSFIDSCVWGHSGDLNKRLNDCNYTDNSPCHHCECGEFSYNLSCVHMMLSSALATMIDKSECIFFLNTPSSLNINKKTESPWIYYELNIASVVQEKSNIKKPMLEGERYLAHAIEFTPKLKGMIDIDADILKKWEHEYNPGRDNPYTVLYRICGGGK